MTVAIGYSILLSALAALFLFHVFREERTAKQLRILSRSLSQSRSQLLTALGMPGAPFNQENFDMDLPSVIKALTDEVTAQKNVEDSAVTLIGGLRTQLAAAIAAAATAGATPEQLQALTDLEAQLHANTAELSAAIAANPQPELSTDPGQ